MLYLYTDVTNDNFDYLDGNCPHTVNPNCPGTGIVYKKSQKVGII